MTKKNEIDLSIDVNRLDEEWVDQPRMYFRFAFQLADARRDLDEAKVDLDVTAAELDQKVRADPAAFGLAKLTEPTVKAAVIVSDGYRTAQEQLLSAKHRVDVLQAAVAALDHRKTALSKLVDLHLASYYSEPRASRTSRERMDEVEKDDAMKQGVRSRGKR